MPLCSSGLLTSFLLGIRNAARCGAAAYMQRTCHAEGFGSCNIDRAANYGHRAVRGGNKGGEHPYDSGDRDAGCGYVDFHLAFLSEKCPSARERGREEIELVGVLRTAATERAGVLCPDGQFQESRSNMLQRRTQALSKRTEWTSEIHDDVLVFRRKGVPKVSARSGIGVADGSAVAGSKQQNP